MSLPEVLDMVGGAFDEKWIDMPTALELIVEHGHVSRERALAMLVTADPGTEDEQRVDGSWAPPADDWRRPERGPDGSWG